MSGNIEQCGIIAKGQLKIFEKTTGMELVKSNLVVKESSHLIALGLGGDLYSTNVKVASWGDDFVETPSQTGYNWVQLESDFSEHLTDKNHTKKSLFTSGHSYPAHKSIRFSFEFNKNTASELVGKNLLEWGLYFNDILFSRVALETNFIFEDWMNIVGYWTLIFTTCSGGYSNFILNQYELNSLWGFDYFESGDTVIDYTGTNDLTTKLSTPKLVTDLIGVGGITDDDRKHIDSIPPYYTDGGVHNVTYIAGSDQNSKLLLNTGKFTIWQWFKINDVSTITTDEEWVMLSKWMTSKSVASDNSYRLYFTYSDDGSTISGTDYRLAFDINDDGTERTLYSDGLNFNDGDTISNLGNWNLVVVTFDYSLITENLIMYLNDEEVGSITLSNRGITPTNSTSLFIGAQQTNNLDETVYDSDKVFNGFIDETAISGDKLSRDAISLLYDFGEGDFYNP